MQQRIKHYMNWSYLWPYLTITSIAILATIPQLVSQSAFIGVDSLFHMNRFYDTMMQIKTGNYSYFQSFFGFDQNGRIINALYGPAFAYLNGLLLLMTKTWVNYQVVSSIILFIIAGSLMYQLCLKNGVRKTISFVLAVIYMFSPPILLWNTSQQFTSWGVAFTPLIMLMGTQMMREHRVHWVKLALAMTLILEVHNATTLVCVLALIPFFIIGWIKSCQPNTMVINLCKAIGLTLLLSVNMWAGMLEVMLSNHLLPVYPNLTMDQDAMQLLRSSTNLDGSAVPKSTLGLFILVLIGLICLWNKVGIYAKVIAINGFVFLWISSNWFPWRAVSKAMPSLDYIIQSPYRIFIIPNVLLCLVAGIFLSNLSVSWLKNSGFAVLSILALFLFFRYGHGLIGKINTFNTNDLFINNRFSVLETKNHKQLRTALRSNDLSQFLRLDHKKTPDYLPVNQKISTQGYFKLDPYDKYNRQFISNRLSTQHTVKGDVMTVTWQNEKTKDKKTLLPVVKYAHSQVTLNGKKISNPTTSSIGALIVNSQPGTNRLTIRYQASSWYRWLLGLSLFSWTILLIYGMLQKLKKVNHSIKSTEK